MEHAVQHAAREVLLLDQSDNFTLQFKYWKNIFEHNYVAATLNSEDADIENGGAKPQFAR